MWMIVMGAIVAGVIVIDQVSKALVLSHLYHGQVVLIPDVLHFTYVENRGMAFGMLSDHRWVFMILSVVGIGLVGFYMVRYVKSTLGRVALSLIIGGGIGNMIDRISLGFVVDFIDFCAFDFWIWVFNIADSAVCIGAALFIIQLIREIIAECKKPKNGTKKAEASTPSHKVTDGAAPDKEDGQNGAES